MGSGQDAATRPRHAQYGMNIGIENVVVPRGRSHANLAHLTACLGLQQTGHCLSICTAHLACWLSISGAWLPLCLAEPTKLHRGETACLHRSVVHLYQAAQHRLVGDRHLEPVQLQQ